jgi:hypothetical protein
VPHLEIISASKVASSAGEQPLVITDAESLAVQLGATFYVQPSLEFGATTATALVGRHGALAAASPSQGL